MHVLLVILATRLYYIVYCVVYCWVILMCSLEVVNYTLLVGRQLKNQMTAN